MHILIIIALLIAILAVIFALQNITVVTVTILFWSFHAPLALVLLITLAVGVLISLLASMPGTIRSRYSLSGLKKRAAALELERNTYQQKNAAAEQEISGLEEQLANLSAEVEKHNTQEPPQLP